VLSPISRILTAVLLTCSSSWAFAAACPASSSTTTEGNGSCTVTDGDTNTVIQLNFNTGFNGSSALAAAGGNNGTTEGAQRKLAFIKAAEIVASQIVTPQTLIIDADFSALSCNAGSAVLGSAGATSNIGNVTPLPAGAQNNTFYPIGLLNALGSTDYDTGISDITASYNSDLGDADCLASSSGWYYGYDAPPNGSYIGFVTVLLHEITHGLGFASLVNKSTGAKPSGLDDIYSTFLFDDVTSRTWADAAQSNADRAASATSGNRLLWNGSETNAQAVGVLTAGYKDDDSDGNFTVGDRIQMYAPNPVEGGSSVSHFDTAVSPNELMEPQYTEGSLDLGLAKYLLQDIGWTLNLAANNPPTLTAVDQTTNEDVALVGIDASGWANDPDGNALTFSITSCPTNLSCSINSIGTSLSIIPGLDYNGASNTVEISVTDGIATAVTDTFNVTVNPVNDAPVMDTTADVSIERNASLDVTLNATDVDGDALTYNLVSADASLNAVISSNTLTFNPTTLGNFSVVVEASDGTLSDDDSFNVEVYAIPSLGVGGDTIEVNESTDIGNQATEIEFNDGPSNASVSLEFEGTNANGLLSTTASGVSIAMPNSGAFAGEYTLTITNTDDGSSYTYTLVRKPQISVSASRLLANQTTQTLTISGAVAGTQFDLTSSESLLQLSEINGVLLTQISAADNSSKFNPAIAYFKVGDAQAELAATVSISSDHGIQNTDVTLEPSRIVELKVEDEDGNGIAESHIEWSANSLDTLDDYGIAEFYTSNVAGELILVLPELNTDLTGKVSANGYENSNFIISPNSETLTVVLEKILGTRIIGTIEALAPLSFAAEKPQVIAILNSGEEVVIPLDETSSDFVTFDFTLAFDQGEPLSLRLTHSKGITLETPYGARSASLQNTYFMQASEAEPTVTVTIGKSSGGGVFGYLILLLTLTLFTRRVAVKD